MSEVFSSPFPDPYQQEQANYVKQALGEALAGKPVSQPNTRAYGCSIKYADAG